MKVLMVHAMYAGAGGENLSVLADTEMLRTRGHDVETYFPRNADLGARGQVAAVRRIALPDLRTLRHVVRTWKPDLAHVNNTFPSPGAALYRLLSTAGVPIVQHLRNYRMFCPAGTLFRDGTECTECVRTNLRLPAVRHACYRGSRAGSAVAALATDRAFRHQIHADGFIAVSEAMKRRMVGLGLPRDRIFVKHNVIGMCDELVPPAPQSRRDTVVYVGRATEEKGFPALLRVWQRLPEPPLRLLAIGSGTDTVAASVAPRTYRGRGEASYGETMTAISNAAAVVVPSLWDEPLGRVALEAASVGVPVVATAVGALPELVVDGVTGWLTHPSEEGLEDGLRKVMSASAHVRADMGGAARARYDHLFSKDAAMVLLEDVYQKVRAA